MSAIDDYYKQLQALNEQRRMTGNATLNRGMDAALAEGYMDAQYNQQNKQQALNLQRRSQQQQAYNQNAIREQAKESQKLGLVTGAVGGVTQLGTQLYGLNKMFPGKQALDVKPMSQSWNSELVNATSTGLTGPTEYADFLTDASPLKYGSPEYLAEAAKWDIEPIADTKFLDDVFSWFGGLF